MKKNMSSTDRILRLLTAAIIVALFSANVVTGAFAIVLLILAGVFALTGFVSFCPLYFLFGLSTQAKKK